MRGWKCIKTSSGYLVEHPERHVFLTVSLRNGMLAMSALTGIKGHDREALVENQLPWTNEAHAALLNTFPEITDLLK